MELDAAAAGAAACDVLTGLGGVGKTQLAAGLAYRMWQRRELDLLVWVTATSRSSIVTAYARAAADIHGVQDENPDQGVARFLAWLATSGQRWVVVLDDLADPNDLRGLWPPTAPSGRTIVTTRRRDTALVAGRRVVDVGLFTPAESVAYLEAKLGADPARLHEAAELADDLGHLPLALAQAAAYILDRRTMTCAGYRRRLADQARKLPELIPNALPDQQSGSVAAIWSMSIERADEFPPAGLARPVLEMAALLDPNGIPTDVFTSAAVLDHLTVRYGGRQVDSDDVSDALDNLERLNLATHDPANRTVRVHGLLQRVVREATTTAHSTVMATTAADALVEIWPNRDRDRELGQVLRANTAALNLHAGPLLWDASTGCHSVLFNAGYSLSGTGQISAASDYHDTLYTTAVRYLGSDHPHTFAIRNNLAYCRGRAGDPAGAASAYANLLTDELRVLGPDHLHSLTTRNNLAYWQGEAGDRLGAAAALADLLTDQMRVLGPDHPSTLNTRHTLAYQHGEAGDPAGAATALADLLTDQLRVLGPNSPYTLGTRHDLARWSGEAGDPAGAATALADLLTDQVRVLGPDHPDTLTTRRNLACWSGEAGDPASAATALADLLTDQVRVLGPDHPHTLATRNILAYWRAKAADAVGTEHPAAARPQKAPGSSQRDDSAPALGRRLSQGQPALPPASANPATLRPDVDRSRAS
ncbi:tetratricopeptide repeat protein [Micromonospora chersina]|uniref:tetratricopeptide repeat protein n=1 Tax=Micromonospora chersina TaxID=47854 RepID=UPI00340AEE32